MQYGGPAPHTKIGVEMSHPLAKVEIRCSECLTDSPYFGRTAKAAISSASSHGWNIPRIEVIDGDYEPCGWLVCPECVARRKEALCPATA